MKIPIHRHNRQQVPRFNNAVTYFVEEMEFVPGDYSVIGYNPANKVTYLTLFTGIEAKERAFEYRDFKNGAPNNASDTSKQDAREQTKGYTGSGEDTGDCSRECGA